MKRPAMKSSAPLAIAAFIAIPLFFSSLMAASLALEKPHVYQWRHAGRLFTTYHDPTAANEASIWLWALVPPLLLILVGFLASYLPYGFYVACGGAILIAVAVVHRIDLWTVHHTLRFPNGVDLIPAVNAASNKYDPGQWEHNARDTALSLEHWTIGLAVAAALIMAFLTFRREVLGRRPAPAPPPLEGVHGPDVTPPSLPER
ncbi:MAG TPA: hypothetical protein VH416_07150 [Gaiellaceae bacterium]|jgi:hypothetical protein